MASTDNIRIDGIRDARAHLRSIDKRLVPQFNAELRRLAEPIRAEQARLAPRSGATRTGSASVLRSVGRTSLVTRKIERNQHVGDTLRIRASGSSVVIYSRRSGAGVINYGGRHPLFGNRDFWFAQKPTLFMQRGAENTAAMVEREIGQMVDHLLDRL